MLEFLKDPFFFLLYINNLPDDIICNSAIYADDTTLCSKCDQASDLWQQLELAFELELIYKYSSASRHEQKNKTTSQIKLKL